MKKWWQSRTKWLQFFGLLTLLVGSKVPGMDAFLKEYFSEVGVGWAVINMVLRAVTKEKLEIS
jgi:hypothetical protein